VSGDEIVNGTPVFLLCLVLIFLLLSITLVATAIRIIPEYQRAVVLRLGRCIGLKGPGIVILLPFIDQPILVDLREQTHTLAAQSAISTDNVRLTVDISWSYKVIDPAESVLHIGNPEQALQNVAAQFWPAQVETQSHQDLLRKRPELRADLMAELEEASRNWGIKITGVQLGEIQKGS
jgi:regulator of protease activity HflC (stomatin/prohibitin superfamily)